jgi:hypothetical protein
MGTERDEGRWGFVKIATGLVRVTPTAIIKGA